MAPAATAQAPSTNLPAMTCSYEQVIAAAMLGGFPLADLAVAAAIAAAESSRNAAAISPLAGDNSRGYGLWQIEFPTHQDLFYKYANVGGSDPSQVTGPYGGLITGDWIDPVSNAKMAFAIKQSQGWNAWTTYQTGAYLPFLLQAKAALPNVENMWPEQLTALLAPLNNQLATNALAWRTGLLGGAVVGGAEGAIAGVTQGAGQGVLDVYKPFSSVLDFLNALGDPKIWVRIALVVVGGGLVFVGVSMVAKKPAVQVASVAGKVVK